jgi:hypothetical protein
MVKGWLYFVVCLNSKSQIPGNKGAKGRHWGQRAKGSHVYTTIIVKESE